MAEEEKKRFNKKWLIIIAILVLIAIIVVTIILCLPGNPKSAIEALKKEENTFLLSNSKDKEFYDNFEDIVSKSSVKAYNQEMEDVETVLSSLEIVIDKYEDYSIFFEENEYFYDNYKPLTESFNKLQDYKSAIKNELAKAQSFTKDGPDFLRQSWILIRANFEKMLECFETGLSTFNSIFANSYFGVEQNLASTLTLKTVVDYVAVLQQEFEDLIDADKTQTSISLYKYNCHPVVYSFNNFVNAYISNQDDIIDYYFNPTVESNYEKVAKFYTLYQQQTFQQIILSAKLASSDIYFTKVFEGIEDNENVYNQVQIFLGGDL